MTNRLAILRLSDLFLHRQRDVSGIPCGMYPLPLMAFDISLSFHSLKNTGASLIL